MNLEELLSNLGENEYNFYSNRLEEVEDTEFTEDSISLKKEYQKTLLGVISGYASCKSEPKTEKYLSAVEALKKRIYDLDNCFAEKIRDIGLTYYAMEDGERLFNHFDLQWLMFFDDENSLNIKYNKTIGGEEENVLTVSGLTFTDENDFEDCYSIFTEFVATKLAVIYADDNYSRTALARILNAELKSMRSRITLSEEDIPSPLGDINMFALLESIFLAPLALGVKELDNEYNY